MIAQYYPSWPNYQPYQYYPYSQEQYYAYQEVKPESEEIGREFIDGLVDLVGAWPILALIGWGAWYKIQQKLKQRRQK